MWETGWKQRYYKNKFDVDASDEKFRRKVVQSYVEGLCWVLRYYYQVPQSFLSEFVSVCCSCWKSRGVFLEVWNKCVPILFDSGGSNAVSPPLELRKEQPDVARTALIWLTRWWLVTGWTLISEAFSSLNDSGIQVLASSSSTCWCSKNCCCFPFPRSSDIAGD